jgi:hypothetical protein
MNGIERMVELDASALNFPLASANGRGYGAGRGEISF